MPSGCVALPGTAADHCHLLMQYPTFWSGTRPTGLLRYPTEGPGSAHVEGPDQVVRGRKDEQEAVDPVEQAAVSREDPAHVLHAQVSLDHGLRQVPDGHDDGDDQPEHRRLADGP